jgi:hypothetical protein
LAKVPRKKMETINKEMNKIKEENKQELVESKLIRFSKYERKSLIKMGMTKEEMAMLDDPQLNPF